MPRVAIAVIGAGRCDDAASADAYQIGRLLAARGAVLVTGGGPGVMEAASRGARDAGGLVVGILPGLDPAEANDAVELAILTGMGQLRNGVVVSTASAVIAVDGEWGTLSEIGFARKLDKQVIGLRTWVPVHPESDLDGIIHVTSAEQAVERALAFCED